MRSSLVSVLGWVGVVMILVAYGLVTFGIIVPGPVYHFLNLFGAIGIVLSSLPKQNYQPVVINVIWALVAAIALAQLVLFS